LENSLRSLDAFFRNDFRVYDGDAFAITTSKIMDAAFLDKCLVVDQMTPQTAALHALQHYQDWVAVAVVDRTANLSQAAGAIIRSKTAFGGTSPFAVDVILVNEWIRTEFMGELKTIMGMTPQKVSKSKHGKTQKTGAAAKEKEEILLEMNGVMVAEIPRP
jgi:hypothetical protein